MKVKLFYVCVISMLFCVMTACNSATQQEIISKKIGIDISSGTEISSYDTHSGNGDGVSYIVLRFSDDEALQQIQSNPNWERLPANEMVEILVYGIYDEKSMIGPFLSNQNGGSLIPRIQKGYYIFIDRYNSAGKGQDILDRKSFNFTVAFYDIDDNVLYFGELDT